MFLAMSCISVYFCSRSFLLFFFNDTATTEIYTLSLHDALPILLPIVMLWRGRRGPIAAIEYSDVRSEEHTSELQSHSDLVCRLLLEKKQKMGVLCHLQIYQTATTNKSTIIKT